MQVHFGKMGAKVKTVMGPRWKFHSIP